jgi:hypothetical protein
MLGFNEKPLFCGTGDFFRTHLYSSFFYYSSANPFLNEVGMSNPTGKMTLADVGVIVYAADALFLCQAGCEKDDVASMAAWVLRYILFAYGNNDTAVWMLYGGIVLHGIVMISFS